VEFWCKSHATVAARSQAPGPEAYLATVLEDVQTHIREHTSAECKHLDVRVARDSVGGGTFVRCWACGKRL
jgi:hypothetical protein